MHKENQFILDALAKFPGLDALKALVRDMPSDAELKMITDEFVAQLDYDFSKTMTNNFDDMPPVLSGKSEINVPALETSTSGTQPITIRVPVRVLNAFKQKSRELRVPYQRLMNRQLRADLSGL